jgi:uroporphyrinogen-III decarboxylase
LAIGAQELFGFDNAMSAWGDCLVEAQAHGTQWKFPERDFYPRADKYVPLAEVDKVHPVDPMKDKFWSVPLRASSIMQEEIGREVAVVGGVITPFMVASEVVGYENMMMALLASPAGVDGLIRTILESVRAYGEALARTGVGTVFIEDSSAGMEQNSPELCARYDQKYLGEQIVRYRALGLRTIVHNCSAMPYLEMNADLRPDGLQFNLSAVDAASVFSRLKGRTCVMAGIDSRELLFKRPADEVEAKVKETCGLWGKDPGFMLAPDELPYKTPLENIARLRDCAARYGAC